MTVTTASPPERCLCKVTVTTLAGEGPNPQGAIRRPLLAQQLQRAAKRPRRRQSRPAMALKVWTSLAGRTCQVVRKSLRRRSA
jgi:hypothetical protein